MSRLLTLIAALAMLFPLIPAQQPATPAADAAVVEAESGQLTGTRVDTARPGFSGDGYVTGFEDDGSGVAVTIPAPAAGLYVLTITYAADEEKTNDIFVNGLGAGSMVFPPSDGFTAIDAGKVWMEAGDNTVEIRKNWGYFDVDAFRVAPAPARAPLAVSDTLVNPNASPDTQALMTYLTSIYGSQTLSGQGEVANADWVEQTTGERPALLGLDMMDYTPSRVERGTTSEAVEQAIAWHQGGGIVQFQWHWNAPNGLVDTPGNEWYRGFYTEATTFDVADALAHPESENYALLVRDIDAIAVQLQRLEDAGVPVLWRPLHEAQGEWFWWGAKGPEPLKELYALVYDRLTNVHQLDNLIWVWTSQDTPEALDWYPGDAMVDIVGADIYPATGSHPTNLGMFERMVELYGGRKMVAMTENGAVPEAGPMFEQGANWAWFMTWGDMVEDAELNPPEIVTALYQHPSVVNHGDLPQTIQGSGATPAATPGATPVGTPMT